MPAPEPAGRAIGSLSPAGSMGCLALFASRRSPTAGRLETQVFQNIIWHPAYAVKRQGPARRSQLLALDFCQAIRYAVLRKQQVAEGADYFLSKSAFLAYDLLLDWLRKRQVCPAKPAPLVRARAASAWKPGLILPDSWAGSVCGRWLALRFIAGAGRHLQREVLLCPLHHCSRWQPSFPSRWMLARSPGQSLWS